MINEIEGLGGPCPPLPRPPCQGLHVKLGGKAFPWLVRMSHCHFQGLFYGACRKQKERQPEKLFSCKTSASREEGIAQIPFVLSSALHSKLSRSAFRNSRDWSALFGSEILLRLRGGEGECPSDAQDANSGRNSGFLSIRFTERSTIPGNSLQLLLEFVTPNEGIAIFLGGLYSRIKHSNGLYL